MKIDREEYLALFGLSFPMSDFLVDKTKFPNGLTKSQRKKLEITAVEEMNDYHKKRKEKSQEYNKLVAEGKIIPRSRIERLILAARGSEDNESTHAARKVLLKKGINWKSYILN